MPSPFKFLDAYTRADRDQFFGREEETAQLYELVNQNRLVLLYGPSGTGKTSLIQCGLGNRFEATDWLPLFVRRGTHLPTALQKALVEQWEEELDSNFWEIDENPLPTIIEDLFAEYLRPIYLVFDQLEEIFILGDAEEQRIFTRAMADIYHAKLPCRLLFILREEYLAHLYDFEQRIPTLFKRRLRVEAMSAQQAEEVVRRSCERFSISLEDPERNPAQIVSKVSAGRSGVALPYLQVYLDRLYREDFAKTYPRVESKIEEQGTRNVEGKEWPPLTFTTEEIEEFGEIGDVLKVFLQEQTQQIQAEMKARFAELPERAVRKVLGTFATLQGTKIPRLRADLQVPPLREAQVEAILERLLQARILREEEGTYELAHDTLAGEIANQRSGAEQALLEVSELVHNRHRAFTRTQTYLDAKELQLIENFQGQLEEEQRLDAEQWEFVKDSQREAKRRRQNRNRIIAGVFAALSILLVFALVQWRDALSAKELADQQKTAAEKARVEADSAKFDAIRAEREAIGERVKAQRALLSFYQEILKTAKIAYVTAVNQLESARKNFSDDPVILNNRRNEVRNAQRSVNKNQQIVDSLALAIEQADFPSD